MEASKDSTDLIKKNAKIRVDAGHQIGLGHLIRCISLAHMIKDVFNTSFYMLEPPESVLDILQKEGFLVNTISHEIEYLECLNDADLSILDAYHLDTEYQKQVRQKGSLLVCVDDLHDQYFVADIIINHAPGITCSDYSKEHYSKLYLGPEYALLRPEFLKIDANEEVRKGVFVCLGGADPLNLTQIVLESLFKIKPKISVSLVLGAVNDQKEAIEVWAAKKDVDLNIYASLSAREMAVIMKQNRYAIVPSSGILMEALASGLTPLIGYFVDNQRDMYKAWTSLGLFGLGDLRIQGDFEKSLGEFNFDKETHESALSKLIDGDSGKRLLNIIQNEFSQR